MEPDLLPPKISQEEPPLFSQKQVEPSLLGDEFKKNLQSSQHESNASSVKNFYNQNKIYFWAIVLGVFIIGVLSFFAFRKTPAPTVQAANVDVIMDAPDSVASGGEEVYKITIRNNDKNTLTGMQLELVYASGMTYISSTPAAQNISGTSFSVPDLISGQNAVLIVKAKVVGSINDTKQIIARVHYKYSNFNSEFIKEQNFSVRLVASDVVLDFTGPSTLPNAQIGQYTITYQNNSDSDIKNARIQLGFPDGFKFASATPVPDLSNNTWNVNTLLKGGSGTITVQGSFSSNPGESKSFTADFLIQNDSGSYFTQSTAQVVTAISSLPLIISQTLEQNSDSNIINPGDTLRFTISYQNNSSVAATGVNITDTLDSKVLDLSSITAEGAQVTGNVLTWNAASVASLATLGPNETGTVSFSVRVKNPATKDSSINLTVASHIKIKANEYETAFPGSDVSLKVSSPSTIITTLEYSSGQLPPTVGKSTVYKVTFALTNSTDTFSNGMVTAFIPLGPSGFDPASVSQKESGKVTYDPSTGKLTWDVGSLPAHTGQFLPSRQLQFNVTINPSSSQRNQSAPLVKNITFTAADSFTSQNIQNTADDITTNDTSGQFGGQGSVQ